MKVERKPPKALEERYGTLTKEGRKSEIRLNLPRLRKIAENCMDVVEFGVRNGQSTTALLCGQPDRMRSYDIERCAIAERLDLENDGGRTEFTFTVADSREDELGFCDFLFIDSTHTGEHLAAELDKHSFCVTRYIAMHDTETGRNRGWWYRDPLLSQVYGEGVSVGDKGKKIRATGMWPAIESFLMLNPTWALDAHFKENNGLTVLRRRRTCSISELGVR